MVVPRVAEHDLLVAERIPEPLVPGGLGEVDDPDERDPEHGDHGHAEREPAGQRPSTASQLVQHLADEGVELARACRRSRRRSLPSRVFSVVGEQTVARAGRGLPRCGRREARPGAVITTTASNRRSPPVSYRSGISVTATSRVDRLQPRLLLAPDPRVEQRLEPGKLVQVGEHDLARSARGRSCRSAPRARLAPRGRLRSAGGRPRRRTASARRGARTPAALRSCPRRCRR